MSLKNEPVSVEIESCAPSYEQGTPVGLFINMIRLSMIFATQVFIAVKFTAQVDSLRPEFDFWGLEKMSTAIVIRASGLPPLLLSTRDRPLLG